MDRQEVGIWTVARSSADSSVDVPMKSNERQAQESLSSQLVSECWGEGGEGGKGGKERGREGGREGEREGGRREGERKGGRQQARKLNSCQEVAVPQTCVWKMLSSPPIPESHL